MKQPVSPKSLKSNHSAEGLQILISGAVTAKQGKLNEVLAISLEHVKRSRLEPGCISHAVLQDKENPQRLVFIEQWADISALSAHLGLPASRDFGKALTELAEGTPKMTVFEANALKVGPT